MKEAKNFFLSSRAEAKTKIQNNRDLDQYCPRHKQPLKPMKEHQEDKEMSHPKGLELSVKPHAEKLESSEKVKEVKKEKKRNRRKRQQERSTLATGSNTENLIAKKRKEDQKVICYNCNKKGYYVKKIRNKESQKIPGSLGYLYGSDP